MEQRYFPVWGTCLGMESVLLYYNRVDKRRRVYGQQRKFLKIGTAKSRGLKSEISKHLYNMDKEENFRFYYNHVYSYHPRDFTRYRSLRENFEIIFQKRGKNGQIVTYTEHRHKPFFLSQFHPEKYHVFRRSLKKQTFSQTTQIMAIFKKLIIQKSSIKELSINPKQTSLLVYKANKDSGHLPASFFHLN